MTQPYHLFFSQLLCFNILRGYLSASLGENANNTGNLKGSVMCYFKAAINTASGYSLGVICSYYISRLSFLVYSVE